MNKELKIKLEDDIYTISADDINTVVKIDKKKGTIVDIELFFKKLIINKEINGKNISYQFNEDLNRLFDNSKKNEFLTYLLNSLLKILNEHKTE